MKQEFMPDTRSIALQLLDTYDHGRLTTLPTARNPQFDSNAAYDVAAEIVKLRRARGERCVGRKVGFTNRNIWAEYGATAPIWAHVYDSMLIHAKDNKASLSLSGAAAPRIEPETAFKLCGAVPTGCKDPVKILGSIEWLAPSFEIVDCHFENWKFQPADSIADQSFHWRLVVGEPYTLKPAEIMKLPEQLRECQATLKCNGEVKDRGVASNALDHPALALAFLADVLATQPKFDALAAGEIITTGTLTAALSIKAGETWTSEIGGLPVAPLTLATTS
jgi:2-keto-4-pentenoate hydratase